MVRFSRKTGTGRVPVSCQLRCAEYLDHLAKSRSWTFTRTLDHELAFSESWGLPAPTLRILRDSAAALGLTTQDLVTRLLTQTLDSLARQPRRHSQLEIALQPSNDGGATPKTLHLPPESLQALRGLGGRFGAAVDSRVEFARTFGLPPEALAVLAAEAARAGCGLRDYARLLLWRAASGEPADDFVDAAERPPRPTPVFSIQHRLPGVDYEHLERVAAEHHLSLVEAFDVELDFARAGLLPAPLRRALERSAAAAGMLLVEHLRETIARRARELPCAPELARLTGRRDARYIHISSLSPANRAFLKSSQGFRVPGLGGTRALISYCRGYGLHPGLLAALEAEAGRMKCTTRELVLWMLWDEASSPTSNSAASLASAGAR